MSVRLESVLMGDAENAGLENAGLENAGPNLQGRKRQDKRVNCMEREMTKNRKFSLIDNPVV